MANRPPVGPTLVFVDDLGEPVLRASDAHHLLRVLRLRPGTEVTVADGHGSWRRAALMPGAVSGRLGELGQIQSEPEPDPEITIAFGVTKGAKPELVVQKLTELGVQHIVAFVAARSVVAWDESKRARNRQRWQVVAREACMQCRRARLPEIGPILDFSDVASKPGACLAAFGGDPVSIDSPVVMIGPEGGWSDAELAHSLPRVSLGDHVLRAETAAIAAAALLGTERGQRQSR